MSKFKYRLMLAVASMALASTAGAESAAPLVAKRVVTECDVKVRDKLVAPLEAKSLDGTEKWSAPQKEGGPAWYKACYQARTQGGGFGRVEVQCAYTPDGKVVETWLFPEKDLPLDFASACRR